MKTVCRAMRLLFIGGLPLSAVTACDQSTQPLSHDEIIRADFAEIIALEGLDCGEVVRHSVEDHLEYHIECDTGDVYRIHVSPEGHVREKTREN